MLAEMIRTEIMEYVAPMFEQILAKMDTLATKQDVDELRRDVAKCATKEELAEVKVDVGELKVEMAEVKRDVGELKVEMAEVKRDVGEL
ncbi:hypothetical protein, partial [Streptosporangium sp. NPDC023615]|uniref:hypothetical protein n=1 Tax=Streptosporangium sp. NPDC023615 TaxID=3154794 RepID=UPI003420D0E3